MPQSPHAFFLPTPQGPLFCLFHAPQDCAARGRVLHFHPFAEELNTCRRASAQHARALAEAGFAVMQFDLWGCGDSAGEFEQANWSDWLVNGLTALRWLDTELKADSGAKPPLWFWGVRGGALLAAQTLAAIDETASLLLWQPCSSGKQLLQQLLRTQAVSQWLGGTAASADPLADARTRWPDRQPLTVAGYTINAGLSQALANAELSPPPHQAAASGRLIWLESSTSGDGELSPGALRQLDLWSARGWPSSSQRVRGPAFWQNIGTDDAPNLIQASLSHLIAQENRQR